MGDLGRVLARLAADEAYRGWLRASPEAALRGYALSEHDRRVLQSEQDGWFDLLARASRELGIGEDVWAPTAEPSSTDPAPRRPDTGLQGLPDARVQLRIGPARAEDGRTVWSISLVPPGQPLPPPVPGEVRPFLCVTAAQDLVAAWLAPEASAEGAAVDVDGPRWSHRTGARERSLGARARAASEHRLQRIEELLAAVVADGEAPVDIPAPAEAVSEAAPPSSGAEPDIIVVGLGLTGVQQITREAEEALRRAKRVFSIDSSPAVRAFLKARCGEVSPLFEQAYRQGGGRLPTYLHIAARVLDAAVDHAPVVLAVQGHPTLFSYIPVLLRDVGPLMGLRVQIQPGISSRAALLAHLALDPADHGIQAFEATDLLLRRRPLSPDCLTLLWQVGNLETRLHSGRPSRPERLYGLTAWLRAFYPDDHPITGVVIGLHPGVPTTHWTVPLSELPSVAERLHASTTLVIPPVGRRALVDRWLASVVDDPAHLHAITRPLSVTNR